MTTINTVNIEAAVDRVMQELGGKIVLGMPLGLGKPVQFANALYRRVKATPEASLDILTALSLTKPAGASDLQNRFLNPFAERVWGDYENLDYAVDVARNKLPPNIKVHEFYYKPGAVMGKRSAQENHISTNYTFAVRELLANGANVVAQMLAPGRNGDNSVLSFSCNPELSHDILDAMDGLRAQGKTVLSVAQLHPDLPYMAGDAEVKASRWDVIIDDPQAHKKLFSTPNMPVDMQDHFTGLNASALIQDGGTLQIGIGALGDAVVYSTIFRHQHNADYREVLKAVGTSEHAAGILDTHGGLGVFEQGLYGCSEMFINGFVKLMEAGIVKRQVFQDPEIQRKVNAGELGPARVEGGIFMYGGFYLGPNVFYQALRDMAEEMAKRINMTRIGYVNHLFGGEEIKRLQRTKARFCNTVFNVNLLGAAAADQLENGQVISGVGGQYNFVAQAHELPDARSVLMLRSFRVKDKEAQSNVVWNYGHTTIPRHLRDVIVTEYGIADLRSKPDQEVIKALISVADSRFQEGLRQRAVEAGKLPADYTIPERFKQNTPERLANIYKAHRKQGHFPDFPFGSDFTYVEEELTHGLGWLKERAKPRDLLKVAKTGFLSPPDAAPYAAHLERMGYDKPRSFKENLYRRLLLVALESARQERA